MFTLDQDTLIMVLHEHTGVDLVSLGKPRDGFVLKTPVPHWTSGFGGTYEMVHSNVPEGVMVAAGDLEDLKLDDFDGLVEKLKKLDIYPSGANGDFTGKDVEELRQWFFDRSVRNDEVNHQWPIKHTAHQLTPEKLDGYYGKGHYQKLVDALADGMNIFKHPGTGELLPADRAQRVEIVQGLLESLSEAVRYTRIDGPAIGYQISTAIDVTKEGAGTIRYLLEDVHKIIVMRKDPKTGEVTITPLDRAMIGKTYDTKDGQPLGDRGYVDLATILERAAAIEAEKKAATATGLIKDIVEAGPQRRGTEPSK